MSASARLIDPVLEATQVVGWSRTPWIQYPSIAAGTGLYQLLVTKTVITGFTLHINSERITCSNRRSLCHDSLLRTRNVDSYT